MRRWYWYDSGFACGAIITEEMLYVRPSGATKQEVIVDTAPIFRRLKGKPVSRLCYGQLIPLLQSSGKIEDVKDPRLEGPG